MPAGQAPPRCSGGHLMSVENFSGGAYSSGWSCDRCSSSNKPSSRWRCGPCGYDVCFSCIPQSSGSAAVPSQSTGYPGVGYPPSASGFHGGYQGGYQGAAGGYGYDSYGQPTCMQFTGQKKALLIGINYLRHTTGRLNGCINDVNNMKAFLIKHYNFPASQIVVLTDDAHDKAAQPTKANIWQYIQWLVSDAKAGDSLFFQFSGHGSQVRDTSGDEDDGYDETICPVDYNTNGMIVDDDLHAKMCMKIPAGCRLTAVMDCCMFIFLSFHFFKKNYFIHFYFV